jgi:hypothetical protein
MPYPTPDVNYKLRQWLQEAPQREKSNRLLQYLILGVADFDYHGSEALIIFSAFRLFASNGEI